MHFRRLLVSALLSGCSVDHPNLGDAGSDATGDTSSDTATDIAFDVAADSVTDTVADSVTDTVADAVTDSATDPATDSAADVATDTDGSADAPEDSVADAEADTGTDAESDAAPDAETDACERPATDPSHLGDDCGEAGIEEFALPGPSVPPPGPMDTCPEGYTCETFSGVIAVQTCQIRCTADCDCPLATVCEESCDKAGCRGLCTSITL